MSASFCLVSRPWIRVVTTSGRVETLGLAALFQRLDEIVDLAEPPDVWIGVMRLLACVLQRVVAPDDDAAWRRSLVSDHRRAVREYLEEWQHRFDLFDARRPFLQVPRLDEGARTVSASKLIPTRSAGDIPVLMDYLHSTEADPPAMTPECVARALVSYQTMSPGGGTSQPTAFRGAAVANAAQFVLLGDTLRDTLAGLLLTPDLAAWSRTAASGSDLPSWEASLPKADVEGYCRHSRGLLDHLSWTPRAVRLLPEAVDGQVVVRQAQIRAGHSLLREVKAAEVDPFACYELADAANPKKRRCALNVNTEATVYAWTLAVKALAGGPGRRRPLALEQALRVGDSGGRLRVVAAHRRSSSYRMIAQDEVQLGASLVGATERAGAALAELDLVVAGARTGLYRAACALGRAGLEATAQVPLRETLRGAVFDWISGTADPDACRDRMRSAARTAGVRLRLEQGVDRHALARVAKSMARSDQ